ATSSMCRRSRSPPARDDRVRYRPACRRGNAGTRVRHGDQRPPADRRDACSFPGLCPPGAGWGGLPDAAGAVGPGVRRLTFGLTGGLLLASAASGAAYTLAPGPAFLALLGIGASQGRRAGALFLGGHFVGDVLWASLSLIAIIGA